MEPQDGSTLGSFPSHHLFQEHRGNGKNLSDIKTPDVSFLVDSGYVTTSTHGSSIISNPSTPSLNSGSISAELLTPQRYLVTGNSSNYVGAVLEQAEVIDAVKLTPVTENIRSICNFHITTPKDAQYAPGAKRNVAAVLNFQDFESTPKKPRVDVAQNIENVPGDIFCNTTPRKTSKLRSKKQSFRKKLKSAPDLDIYFNVNNIENEQSPRRGNISPIFDKSESRGSRTPLSSSSSNLLRISTPKSSSHNNSHGGMYDGKPMSVKKLLTFSDSQFEHLLRVEEKEDLLSSSTTKKTPPIVTNRSLATSTSSTKKCLTESFVRASNSCANFERNANIQHDINKSIRPLSFTTAASSEDKCDISAEQASRKFRKIFSVTSTVLRDRELSRRHLTSSIKSLQKPYGSSNDEKLLATTATPVATATTKTTKKCKTETESQGFQDILNISNVCCHDMEISAICENDSAVVKDEAPGPVSANYDIKSAIDLNLNDSIECEGRSPPRMAREASVEESRLVRQRSTETASSIPLPRTPKKVKPASVDRERYEILYPIIHRTPSKYNPYLRRAAYKRKSVQNLSNNFKRQCKYYGGNTYLNIIAKLGTYGHILQRIFHCVTPKDLANMCEVSTAWRQAVQSNRWAWQQAEKYRKECRSLKENEGHAKLVEPEAVKDERSVEVIGAIYNKTPFNQSNIRVDRKRTIDGNRSPPVSPSKRKFHENQKVVRTLAPNEKLIKCPRCNKSSRIFNVLPADMYHHINNSNSIITSTNKLTHTRSLSETFHLTNKKSLNLTHHRNLASLFDCLQQEQQPQSSLKRHSLATPEMTHFPLSSSKHRPIDSTFPRMRFGKSYSCDSGFAAEEEPVSPFAECSGIVCGYRFCPECFCDYHPGTNCSLYQPSSPSKDDGQSDLLPPVVAKKNTRRKTLKRLCF